MKLVEMREVSESLRHIMHMARFGLPASKCEVLFCWHKILYGVLAQRACVPAKSRLCPFLFSIKYMVTFLLAE